MTRNVSNYLESSRNFRCDRRTYESKVEQKRKWNRKGTQRWDEQQNDENRFEKSKISKIDTNRNNLTAINDDWRWENKRRATKNVDSFSFIGDLWLKLCACCVCSTLFWIISVTISLSVSVSFIFSLFVIFFLCQLSYQRRNPKAKVNEQKQATKQCIDDQRGVYFFFPNIVVLIIIIAGIVIIVVQSRSLKSRSHTER